MKKEGGLVEERKVNDLGSEVEKVGILENGRKGERGSESACVKEVKGDH